MVLGKVPQYIVKGSFGKTSIYNFSLVSTLGKIFFCNIQVFETRHDFYSIKIAGVSVIDDATSRRLLEIA